MKIYYMSPGTPETLSGGTRKLYDHVDTLKANGFDAKILHQGDGADFPNPEEDVVVIPEVYGDYLPQMLPRGIRRISFVQNSYLVYNTNTRACTTDEHPFNNTPDLIAVMTESQHTEDRVTRYFPDLKVPLIRTHSSGNSRNGEPAGFSYGDWPREKWVMHFNYKYEGTHGELFKGLTLPKGWEFKSLAGLTDEEIQVALRTGAVFTAANKNEGMCAPASEAIISGAVNVCWPGGPTGQTEIGGPMEYLNEGRGVIATQDDLEDLRVKIRQTVKDVNDNPEKWADKTAEWSEWFQETYSIDREHEEIMEIMEKQIYLPRAIDL